MDVNDLQGATVDLVVGQVLDIDTGSLAVDSYTGEVEDDSVAEFTAGREDGGTTYNPGVTGLAEGTTKVVLSNEDGGIQDVTFTVDVAAGTDGVGRRAVGSIPMDSDGFEPNRPPSARRPARGERTSAALERRPPSCGAIAAWTRRTTSTIPRA